MTSWQENLQTIGAELFLRYRKRLTESGIALEIHRDYPGLCMLDVLVRVHAGRRIIQDGDDFRALEAIRSGRWQRMREAGAAQCVSSGDRRDWISRALVRLGGALFVGFCVLSLAPPLAGGPAGLLVLGAGAAVAVGIVLWRKRAAISQRIWRRPSPLSHAG